MPKLEPVDWKSFGFNLVAGVDEAGRGCLAGPVCAAAVMLSSDFSDSGITDSKLLSPQRRTELAKLIKATALCWSVAYASVEEIDELNILRASHLAMRRAVENLKIPPELVLVDGNMTIGAKQKQIALVKGDLRCLPISAASILAKTSRDLLMEELDEKFSGYGLSGHKGYPTASHKEAIIRLGPTSIHRKTFAGVKEQISAR